MQRRYSNGLSYHPPSAEEESRAVMEQPTLEEEEAAARTNREKLDEASISSFCRPENEECDRDLENV